MNKIYFCVIFSCLLFQPTKSENTKVISSQIVSFSGGEIYYETFGTFGYHFSSELNFVQDLEVLKIEDDCVAESYVQAVGKIVLVEDFFGCWTTRKIFFAIEAGASAVGVIENHPGWRYNYKFPMWHETGSFPVFSVDEESVERWIAQQENRTVLITLEEIDNPYQVLYESTVFTIIQIFFLCFFVFWAVYVVRKLVLSIQYMGFVSILSICLGIELIGTFCRIAWWVDPIGSRQLYSLLLSRMFFGLASDVPIFIIQVLLALYWMESLKAINVSRLLSPLSIIIVIIMGLIFIGLDVLAAWSTLIGIEIEGITGGIITIFVLVITIFYFVIVFKLLKYQKKLNSQRKKQKNCTSIALYILSGVLCIIYLITAILITIFSSSPVGYAIWYILMSVIIWAITSTKIIPINPRGNKTSHSASKGVGTAPTKKLSLELITGSSISEITSIQSDVLNEELETHSTRSSASKQRENSSSERM